MSSPTLTDKLKCSFRIFLFCIVSSLAYPLYSFSLDSLPIIHLNPSLKTFTIPDDFLLVGDPIDVGLGDHSMESSDWEAYSDWKVQNTDINNFHVRLAAHFINDPPYKGEWWLRMPYNYVNIRLIKDGIGDQYIETGNLVNRKDRPIQSTWMNGVFVPIKLDPGQNLTAVIDIKQSPIWPNPDRKFEIVDPEVAQLFANRLLGRSIFYNGLLGACFILLALYCLSYFIYSREVFALVMMAYCICIITYFQGFSSGLYRLNIDPELTIYGLFSLTHLTLILSLIFIILFLKLESHLHRWHSILVNVVRFLLVYGVISTVYLILTKEFVHVAITVGAVHGLIHVFIVLLGIRILKFRKVAMYVFGATLITSSSIILIAQYFTITSTMNAHFLTIIGCCCYGIGVLASLAIRAAVNFREKEVAETARISGLIKIQEAQRLEHFKTQLFTNISHELRTPLSLILGPVRSLIKHGSSDKDEVKLLHFVKRNAEYLHALVDEILDLLKLEEDKHQLEDNVIHLDSFLSEQLLLFQSVADQQGVDFSFEYHFDDELLISMDKKKFEKILNNYLSNAMKFTPVGGTITFQARDLGESIEIEVSDSGSGIEIDDLPHVFERFYQSKSNPSKKGGLGIGLAIVKEMAELMNGTVRAESTPGVGSSFFFTFPKRPAMMSATESVAVTDNSATGTSPIVRGPSYDPKSSSLMDVDQSGALTPHSSSPAASHYHLLIVEDNEDLRSYLAHILSDYLVTTTCNGQEALDFLCSGSHVQKIDLIISDLMMPVMDGIEFFQQLKSNDKWRHLPTIMLTARANVLDRLKALRIGVDDYLTKPFLEEELIARITNLLRYHRERLADHVEVSERIGRDQPGEPVVSIADTEWLIEVEDLFTKFIADKRLKVDFAAKKMNLSARQFHRRLKRATGMTPNLYLREMRLQLARELLNNGRYTTVKEVMSVVGLNDTRHFSQLYENRFGIRPSSALA